MLAVRKPGSGRRPKVPYSPELAVSLRQHFELAAQHVEEQVRSSECNDLRMPTFVAWRRAAGVPASSLRSWLVRQSEFREAHDYCLNIQARLGRLRGPDGLPLMFVPEGA